MIHVTYSDPEGWFDDEGRIPPDEDVFLPYEDFDDDGFMDYPDVDDCD